MKSSTQATERNRVSQSRRPPVGPWSRRITYASQGQIEAVAADGPVELILEVTNDDGELSAWFDDFWWVDVLTMYQKRAVTLHIAPTRDAILHPVVLHQLEMLRRVEPKWQVIGYLFDKDLVSLEQVKALTASPYHELRVISSDTTSTEETARLIEELAVGVTSSPGRRPNVIRAGADDAVVRRVMGVTSAGM